LSADSTASVGERDMSDVSTDEVERLLLEATTSRSRRVRNRAASVWMTGSLIVALVPLALIVGYVISKGISSLSWSWFTEDLPTISRKAGGGMGPAIAGTLIITFGAAVMAIPLGILGAIYLHEYGGKTGVPSIVMGLFIYTIWTVNMGLNGFGGSLALACLMLPIIIRTTEEMLRLVPDELRQGSYALGNRKWRTIVTVVLPAAFGGITSGVMLAIARAAGETAPLVFTIGAARNLNLDLFHGPMTALSVQIFGNAQTPFAVAQSRAWGAALTLVAIVFMFTVLARVVSARVARRHAA
jgi:phosphate transport system permease protein